MGYEEAGRLTMNLLTTQVHFLTLSIGFFADAQPIINLDGDANNSLSLLQILMQRYRKIQFRGVQLNPKLLSERVRI